MLLIYPLGPELRYPKFATQDYLFIVQMVRIYKLRTAGYSYPLFINIQLWVRSNS